LIFPDRCCGFDRLPEKEKQNKQCQSAFIDAQGASIRVDAALRMLGPGETARKKEIFPLIKAKVTEIMKKVP
jgi:hypothetical protein